MNKAVYGRCSFVAKPAFLALLFAGYLLCGVAFSLRSQQLGPGNATPDTRPGYTREELKDLLAHFGADGRHCYALTECTLDVLFPLIYCGLFAGFLAHVYPRAAARCLVVLPLAAMLCELSENFHFVHLACRFDDFDNQIAFWYWSAVISSAAKYAFITLALVVLIVGAAGRLLDWWPSAAAIDRLHGTERMPTRV